MSNPCCNQFTPNALVSPARMNATSVAPITLSAAFSFDIMPLKSAWTCPASFTS